MKIKIKEHVVMVDRDGNQPLFVDSIHDALASDNGAQALVIYDDIYMYTYTLYDGQFEIIEEEKIIADPTERFEPRFPIAEREEIKQMSLREMLGQDIKSITF